jgi:hypothetical protein
VNLFIFPKLIKVCKIRLAITGERGKQIFLLCFRKCLIPETLLSIKIYCFHTATQQRWKKYYRKSTLHFSNQTLKSFTNNFFHLYCLFESQCRRKIFCYTGLLWLTASLFLSMFVFLSLSVCLSYLHFVASFILVVRTSILE